MKEGERERKVGYISTIQSPARVRAHERNGTVYIEGMRGYIGRGYSSSEMDESCWGLKGPNERVNLK